MTVRIVLTGLGAKAFYESMLGIELSVHQMGDNEMAWFPMSETALGATGSLVKGEGYVPSSEGTTVYFSAPDLDGSIERARNGGGAVLLERTSNGFFAFVQDTEGNRIGLHSRD